MVICPQVLHAGASDCMFLAAAFTASIPAGAAAVAATCCSFCAGAGAVAGAVTRMLLNSGLPSKVASPSSPVFSTCGRSNTCSKSVLFKYS